MPFIEELAQPISGQTSDPGMIAFLGDLQANILKGHGRHHSANVFIRFPAGKAAKAKAFLRQLAAGNVVQSARNQLRDAKAIADAKAAGNALPATPSYFGAMLTKAGYDYLGVVSAKQPNDASFIGGMRGSKGKLSDPDSNDWEVAYRTHFHALILIAAKNWQT
jgi:deferrochelatase/peroxidase EfeB